MSRLVCRLLLVLALLASLARDGFAAPLRNVLWICADDHAAYVLGCYGNRQARTPNLDRLAASGMRFDRAFCNSPVCTASRQSFITGRYPRSLGVTELQTPLPEHETTLADRLKSVGYTTAAFGKMHFNSRFKHGFDRRLDLGAYDKQRAARQPSQPAPPGPVLPPWKPFKDPARIWLNASCLPFGAVDADMDGTYFASAAASFLAERHDQPFFLFVSFYEPHSPFHFPVEDRGKFDPSTFEAPLVGPQDDDQIPLVFRNLTLEEKQGIAAAYYTSVEFLDRNVGRVLEALERSGQANHTLVIYTGDHGYLLGQHGRFEKHCSFEEAIRAPLLMRAPGVTKPHSHTEALVEFIDIVPTVLDWIGHPIPDGRRANSLMPLLRGEMPTHRPQVFIEYAPNDEAAVRDDRWKLIYERGKRRRTDGYDPGLPLTGPKIRLYDLVLDPHEMHNVAQETSEQPRVHRMLALLAEHLKGTARQPELIPETSDPLEILDYCVQPRDVPR